MASWQTLHTARTPKRCDHEVPRCSRDIKPGERYLRAVASPNDPEVNQSSHWIRMNICSEHITPGTPLGRCG
jgi:hypothetical protein